MIVHKNSKKLLLNVSNPQRITEVIPTARTFEYRGRTLVAVPHRDDETKVLQNMGIDAPSPVLYYYGWPSIFKSAYDHQRDTVRFLTSNKRAFCLNDLGCVDSDTEYLSPTGWRKISEYTEGVVGQYVPESGAVEFVEPLEFVKKPCESMYHIKTKYGLDQMLSPEHRVLLVTKENRTKREVISASQLYARQEMWVETGKNKKSLTTIGWSKAAIPVIYSVAGGTGIDMAEHALRVQIAVIADGHFPSRSNQCVIRLKRSRKIERMHRLLNAAGIEYKVREQNTATAQGFHVFTFYAPLRVKEFDARFWDATNDQLAVVRDEVLHWDGCIRQGKTTREFSSMSKQSADFVQYAFNVGGHTARIRRGIDLLYTVIIRDNGNPLQVVSNHSDGSRGRVMRQVPSTDGYKYCFMVPSSFLIFRRNGCVFASGNTGKTISTLWAYDYLRTTGAVKKVLIVSPLSTLERAWGDEIWKNFPHLTFAVLHGSREKRLKLLEEDVDIYLINHDGIKVNGLREALAKRPDIDIVIIDEVASFRNHSTDRWKAMNEICNRQMPRRLWGLTGTPTPNDPTDAWAQCRLVVPDRVPRYFTKFRDMTMRQITQYKWVAKDNALDVVYEAMQPSIRYKRSDCIDLPPVVFQTRHAEMTEPQKKAYKLMLSKLAFEAAGNQVVAVNEAVKASKLVQIACGAAYGDDGVTVRLDVSTRIDLVKEIIEEAASKVIVFIPFTAALQHVAQELAKHWDVAIVHGDTKKAERDTIFSQFQRSESPHVIVANPGVMSHGLTLTAASTIIWFAPAVSNEIFEQSCARITRPGQKLNQLIVMIEGSDIERRIYARLQGKQKMQGLLLDMIGVPA